MARSLASRPMGLLVALLALFSPFASALRMFESNSLNPCMKNSSFSATLFHVLFTPDNQTLAVNINGVSQISGKVILEFNALFYGYSVFHKVIDPCGDATLKGLCPMNTGDINLPTNAVLPKSTIDQIPNAIFYVPDIDGKIQIWINSTDGRPLACVEARLFNGKTVYQKGVAWTVAVIAGSGLVISAVVSGLGHSNTAAHVAANALALFGYFQAQAMIAMTAVETPPIVRGWTQNFIWSMGIIRVTFLQKLATWYQRSTGGTPSKYLSSLATTSVQVAKRSVPVALGFSKRELLTSLPAREVVTTLAKRTNSATTNAENLRTIIVRGIERVGFVARIEVSNIFMTGYVFFLIFLIFTVLGVVLFKYICEALVKAEKMHPDKFRDFRNGWHTVLKGILFRIALISFPQLVILCFWQITKRDSTAEVVLAICTIISIFTVLGWACLKVWRIAQRSIQLHKNPAYILYSDPKALNKWGFLYVQFKATMYYFIFVILAYLLVKGLFIAFGQNTGKTQGVAFFIIEGAILITICVMMPYMDKKTNAFNIAIASVNFFNVLLLLFFTGIFGVPPLAIGIMGVLFFLVNVVFAIVILLMVIWASVWALLSKNPDTRYQPMRDDRGSFIKSSTNLGTTELDALGATARGDGTTTTTGPHSKSGANFYGVERKRTGIDDDDEVESGYTTTQSGTPLGNYKSAPDYTNMQHRHDGGYVPAPSPAYDRAASPVNGYSPPRAAGSPPRAAPGAGYAAPNFAAAAAGAALRGNGAGGGAASPWKTGVGY